MPRVKEFVTYFLIQLTSYCLLTINFGSIAHGRLGPALASDALNATLSFWVIRRIAKSDDSTIGWIGYVAGSLVGTAVGIAYNG